MVVPTLLVIGVAPPFALFQTMNWIAIALGYVLLIAADVSTLVLLKPLLIPILYCIKPSSKTPQQHGLDNCRRCTYELCVLVRGKVAMCADIPSSVQNAQNSQ